MTWATYLARAIDLADGEARREHVSLEEARVLIGRRSRQVWSARDGAAERAQAAKRQLSLFDRTGPRRMADGRTARCV